MVTGAAVVSALVGVYSAYQAYNTPMPSGGAPPPPANAIIYNADGSITETKWDSAANTYVTKSNAPPPIDYEEMDFTPLVAKQRSEDRAKIMKEWSVAQGSAINDTHQGAIDKNYNKVLANYNAMSDEAYKNKMLSNLPALEAQLGEDPDFQKLVEDWKATSPEYAEWQEREVAREKNIQLREDIRIKMLENLDQTPEDRIAAYEEYGKAYSDAMHREVDEQFQKTRQSLSESMEARGMTGSRADVDLASELEGDKLDSDRSIADSAIMAKSSFEAQDRNAWLSTLQGIDSGLSGIAATEMNKSLGSAQLAAQGTAGMLGQWQVQNSAEYQKWQSKMNQNLGMSNLAMNTSSGLAFLYGYNKPANNPMAPGGGGNAFGGNTRINPNTISMGGR